ncbi:Inosine-uridine preferring nucleoside hydrolase [Furfurilactobacillus rossiae]|nr:Inosine-uridine preferring nucleoside hydrolase [Furfurilactobacillus rossiae]
MTKIILDCDPGHDDALAMTMAIASPKIELAAVTTSAGNQTPEKNAKQCYAHVNINASRGYSRCWRKPDTIS